MIYINKKTFLEKIIVTSVFVAFIALNYFVFFGKTSVIAQSVGGGGVSLVFLIGGETKGISTSSDMPLCCNGVKLEFSSIDSNNPYIVDEGEPVLWAFGTTGSYLNGNELTEDYNTLGRLTSGQCITIISECEATEDINVIKVVGTSPGQSSGGGLGGVGGGGF